MAPTPQDQNTCSFYTDDDGGRTEMIGTYGVMSSRGDDCKIE